MWIKVWQRWAHGENKEACTYHEVAGTAEIDELIYEINENHNWSDKFRGSHYSIIVSPPIEWFETQVGFHTDQAASHQKLAKKYQREILLQKINRG